MGKQSLSRMMISVSVASLVVVIATICLAYACHDHFKSTVVSQTLEQLLTTAKAASRGLEEFIDEHSASLKVLSNNAVIQEMAYNKVAYYTKQKRDRLGPSSRHSPLKTLYDIQKSQESEPDILSLSLLDAGGVMLCRYPYMQNRVGMDYSDRPGVAYVLREHKPRVSDVFYNALGDLAISVLEPLFYKDEFVGMLRWMTELDTISKGFIQSISIGQTGYAWMINNSGTILSHPQKEFIGKSVRDLITKGVLDQGMPVDESSIQEHIRKKYDYLNKLKTDEEGYGIYKDCLSDRIELVTFETVSLGETSWYLIMALPYPEIAGPINKHGYSILGITVSFILLFGVGGFALHRNKKKQVQLETEAKYLKEIARSTDALRDSETRYRTLFEESGDAIYIRTKEGELLDVNQSALDFFGYTKEEMIGLNIRNIYVSPDERTLFQKEIEKKGSVRNYEVKLRTKDGTQMDCLMTSSVRQGNDGRILGYQGVIRDITDRKRREEALRRQAQIIDQVHDGVISMDLDGYVTSWNKGAERLYGYEEKEALGKHISFVLPEGQHESLQREIIEPVKKKEVHELELELTRKSGDDFHAHVSLSLLKQNGRTVTGIIGYSMDITKRKRLEAQLKQAQKMEAIGTLAGGIAHDFNNILMGIILSTEMALLDVPQGSPVRQQLERILKAGMRAKDLVRQILAFSRRGQGERKPVQISLIAKEALKLLRASLPTTIEIRQKIAPGTGMMLADSTQMHQVLINLCSNAGHAMRERGGVLEVSLADVDLDSEAVAQYPDLNPGPYTTLSVSDTGHGMDHSVIERIFDPFFSTKGPGEGTGMGLAVVHGIVKDHDGAIAVYSKPGKGTTFQVLLPRLERRCATSEAEVLAPVPTGNERILLVDDDENVIRPMQLMLERLGYEVIAKTNPIEALQAFRADPNRFGLVITDQTMPNMTGQNLAKELTDTQPDIPIILCTGYGELNTSQKARAAGIRELIIKPVVTRELAETIRRVLDG